MGAARFALAYVEKLANNSFLLARRRMRALPSNVGIPFTMDLL